MRERIAVGCKMLDIRFEGLGCRLRGFQTAVELGILPKSQKKGPFRKLKKSSSSISGLQVFRAVDMFYEVV